MKPDDLKKRPSSLLYGFLKLVGALPNNIEGRAIANQLVRAGTAVPADYRAACRGRSKAEFIAKLGTVEEEADESAFWMELIIEVGLLKQKVVESLLAEAYEPDEDHGQVQDFSLKESQTEQVGRHGSKMISNRQLAVGNRQ